MMHSFAKKIRGKSLHHFFDNKKIQALALMIMLTLLIGFIVCAIWLPFGFSLTGLIEEWGVLGDYINYGLFFLTDIHSPIAAHALRPLTVFPQSLAYFLDPDSFRYWHILLMLSLIIKGFSTAWLVWQTTNSRFYSFVAGMLLVVYPADTMQLSFRALHINWALALSLLAGALVLHSFRQRNDTGRLIIASLACLLQLASMLMYEASIPLILLPLIMLWAQNGSYQSVREIKCNKLTLLIWALSLLLYYIYVHITAKYISSYQHAITGPSFFSNLIHSFKNLFAIGLLRGLAGGWFDAIRIVKQELTLYAYIYITLVTGIFLFLAYKLPLQPGINGNNNWRTAIRLFLAGLLLAALGYLPYLFSLSHQYISQRTFLFSSPGCAMLWTALLTLLALRFKKIAFLLSFFLLSVGLGMQLFQFHHYVNLAERQKQLLRDIVENWDANNNDKRLIVFDRSNQINQTWMLLTANLPGGLSYLFDHPIHAIYVCDVPSYDWQVDGAFGRTGRCLHRENNWVFRFPSSVNWGGAPTPTQADIVVPQEKLWVVNIKPDGTAKKNPALNDYQKSLLSGNSSVAKRYRNILISRAWPQYFNRFWTSQDTERYVANFGKWWNMDIPLQGHGWREAEWQVNKFYHSAVIWKAKPNAMLRFRLQPAARQYQLHAELEAILSEDIHNSIQVAINNHPIPFQWLNYNEFSANIPAHLLKNGMNSIQFSSKYDPNTYNLSFRLRGIEILPQKKET